MDIQTSVDKRKYRWASQTATDGEKQRYDPLRRHRGTLSKAIGRYEWAGATARQSGVHC